MCPLRSHVLLLNVNVLQGPGGQGLAAQLEGMQNLQRADFEARAMQIAEGLRAADRSQGRCADW